MRNFLVSCLGTMVGIVVITVLAFIILVSTLSADQTPIIPDNSVLQLNLDKPIAEQQLDDPVAELFPGAADATIGLVELRDAIKAAKSDDKIKGIFLNVPSVMSGFSAIEEIRGSIDDFRASGKWVVAYADYYTEGGYYVSSAADVVYMNPAGQFELNGLDIEVTFFKKLFDKLEIKPQVFRVGDFKSAVEPFIRENMSEENRLQLTEMINDIYGTMLKGLSESRKIPVERLKEMSDKMLVREAKQAVEFGLIDSLYYDDQVKADIRKRLGIGEKDYINFTKYSEYRKTVKSESSSNEIAVIVADGAIMPGKADNGEVGSVTIRDEIRRARNSDKVKAIVLRVNSPGGAYPAADEMWREIELATKQKPVIASMGDYAASGGYFISMGCDTIVAQPNTITGSIGVFSVLFDLSSFLGDKIGVTADEVKTGEIGNLTTVTRPLTDVEKQIWQKQTDEIYEIFTKKAADGRNMSQDAIKKVASGRVWTGTQAKERGLVDVLGTFNDAVNIAANKAGVGDDYQLRYYPRQKSFLEKWVADMEGNTRTNAIKAETGEYYRWYQQWQRVKDYQGVQARMPIEFTIH